MTSMRPLPRSRRLDFSEIPVVDISALGGGDAADDAAVDAIGRACRDVGFFYVAEHGIADGVITDLHTQAQHYFARPDAEKSNHMLNARMRGYLPLDYDSYPGEATQAKSRQEGFWMGYERPERRDNPFDGPNRWPNGAAALQAAMSEYFAACDSLADRLWRAFARALGQGAETFSTIAHPAQSLLKLNHYPPQDNPVSLSHIGVVPHADSGAFTILWQDGNGGLEVESKSGEWVGAPPIDGTFVINLGNLMQIWTDGVFSSTPHRVINRGNVDRYSIPFFIYPAWNAPVTPLFTGAAQTDAEIWVDYQRAQWRRAFPIAGIDAAPTGH